MKRCANCETPAVFSYMNTLYCESHLPRFLKGRNGLSVDVHQVTQDAPAAAPVWVEPTGTPVETFVEPVVEAIVETVVEEPVAAKPAPKKAKYTPKDVAPSE